MRVLTVLMMMFCGIAACGSATFDLHTAILEDPNEPIHLPAGQYRIDKALRITGDGGGLYGPGRIVQTNPEASIVEVQGAADVRIEGVTLSRAEGAEESEAYAIEANDCEGLVIDGVTVRDNRSPRGAITLRNCRRSSIRNSLIENYKRITVDDRTRSELYGYAFRVIDGTGIVVDSSQQIRLLDNRIVERNLLATAEIKAAHDLGRFVEGVEPTKPGRLAPKGDYANNWHQGSAILVTGPEASRHVLIRGNQIEHAAQGIDLHADYVTCSENSIDRCFIGLKVLHGSRHVMLLGNTVSRVDLWGLVIQPGTASHSGKEGRPPNRTTGCIIANNLFTDYGYGDEWHNWKESGAPVMFFDSGPLEENPPMTDILVRGNMVVNSASDLGESDIAPRYAYAVRVEGDQDIRFADNLLHPGKEGVSNVPLKPVPAVEAPTDVPR